MTTIAWDGKTLAGDTRSTHGGLPRLVATKVYRIVMRSGEIVLFGGAGGEAECAEIFVWIENGMASDARPKFEPDSLTAIIARSSGEAFRLDSRCRPLPLIESFHAIGNGRDFAIAAMYCGRSAREAVQIAARFDIYTAGPFTEVSLDDA